MKSDILQKVLAEVKVEVAKDAEPPPDIAICSQCGWRGSIFECGCGKEGDWESGYYDIPTCPKCEDGGCIDDYDMTEERGREWEKWWNEHKKG